MYQAGNLNSWTYETPAPNLPSTLYGYSCASFNPYTGTVPGGCQANYSAPKAYDVGNDLWVFYRGPGLPEETGQLWAWSLQEQVLLDSNFPITDPIAAPTRYEHNTEILPREQFWTPAGYGNGNGYLASAWEPN
jgi:hypothetical protein